MTDEQIIQAVDLCANGQEDCRKCPLHSVYSANCIKRLMNITLDLIKRQQAEIEKLTAENKKIHKAWSEDLQDKIKFLHKKNEQLDDLRLEKYGIKSVNKAVPVTKATERYIERKAYKEFAEEFEKRCIASGIYPAITKDLLKNLVKEKTEESK